MASGMTTGALLFNAAPDPRTPAPLPSPAFPATLPV